MMIDWLDINKLFFQGSSSEAALVEESGPPALTDTVKSGPPALTDTVKTFRIIFNFNGFMVGGEFDQRKAQFL